MAIKCRAFYGGCEYYMIMLALILQSFLGFEIFFAVWNKYSDTLNLFYFWNLTFNYFYYAKNFRLLYTLSQYIFIVKYISVKRQQSNLVDTIPLKCLFSNRIYKMGALISFASKYWVSTHRNHT